MLIFSVLVFFCLALQPLHKASEQINKALMTLIIEFDIFITNKYNLLPALMLLNNPSQSGNKPIPVKWAI